MIASFLAIIAVFRLGTAQWLSDLKVCVASLFVHSRIKSPDMGKLWAPKGSRFNFVSIIIIE
jgi:hypothetical protein